jgi:ligand-binding sensor domain-containing protein
VAQARLPHGQLHGRGTGLTRYNELHIYLLAHYIQRGQYLAKSFHHLRAPHKNRLGPCWQRARNGALKKLRPNDFPVVMHRAAGAELLHQSCVPVGAARKVVNKRQVPALVIASQRPQYFQPRYWVGHKRGVLRYQALHG